MCSRAATSSYHTHQRMHTHYDVLGVRRQATREDLDKQYNELMHTCFAEFRPQVKLSYFILCDDTLRAFYNVHLPPADAPRWFQQDFPMPWYTFLTRALSGVANATFVSAQGAFCYATLVVGEKKTVLNVLGFGNPMHSCGDKLAKNHAAKMLLERIIYGKTVLPKLEASLWQYVRQGLAQLKCKTLREVYATLETLFDVK